MHKGKTSTMNIGSRIASLALLVAVGCSGTEVRTDFNPSADSEDHEGTLIVDLTVPSKKELLSRAVIKAVLADGLEESFELAAKGIAKAINDYLPG